MNQTIRLLIADDHELVREGLRTFLSEESEIEVIGEAANGVEATALALSLKPDVVLMDVVMPEMDGIEATRRIRAARPSTQVLVLTSFTDSRHVREAIQAGAIGYLLKDVLKPELLRAIRAASQGSPSLHPEAQRLLMQQVSAPVSHEALDALTSREYEVLRFLAGGKSNKEIAAALHVTEGTIKGHVSAILEKLGVADRTQAALLAVRQGVGSEA